MAIKIIDEPDLFLTGEEHSRLLAEYQKAFMFYAGTPPTFESWVKSRGAMSEGKTLLNEDVTIG